jgi:hypothetical protein
MPEVTKAHELLRKAQERQRIGAYEALDALLAEHAEDPEALYEGGWRTVVWKYPDDAEMALLRFLDAYPV